jgi:hypothetical protein
MENPMPEPAIIKPVLFVNGNPKPPEYQPAEWMEAHERLKGQDPRTLSLADFASLGFEKRRLLDVIRTNCIECTGGSTADVARCQITTCAFWPYRQSTDPFRAPPSEAVRERGRALAERARLHRLGQDIATKSEADDEGC